MDHLKLFLFGFYVYKVFQFSYEYYKYHADDMTHADSMEGFNINFNVPNFMITRIQHWMESKYQYRIIDLLTCLNLNLFWCLYIWLQTCLNNLFSLTATHQQIVYVLQALCNFFGQIFSWRIFTILTSPWKYLCMKATVHSHQIIHYCHCQVPK